jgi:ornithine decarboxylase
MLYVPCCLRCTDRVIFAHPCKRPCDLRYARDTGVSLTTFDTESELAKIAGAYPGIQLVLRIRCDDPEVSLAGLDLPVQCRA